MALANLGRVPVLLEGLSAYFVLSRPAVKREKQSGQWVELPKIRDGVQGTEVEALCAWPWDTEPMSVKFTIYGPVPELKFNQPFRVKGTLFANPWGTSSNDGKSKTGLWFECEGIEAVSSTSSSAKAAS